MYSSWSAITISDDEDEPPQKPKVLRKSTRKKTTKITNPVSYIISDDDDDDDDDHDDKADHYYKYQQSEKKTKTEIKTEMKTESMKKIDSDDDLITNYQDEENKPKLKGRQKKRKLVVNNCDQKPNQSSNSYVPKNKKIKVEVDSIKTETSNSDPFWKEHELLADTVNINQDIAKNIIDLFSEGNTIPFIARYRRQATGNMSPEALREIKSALDEIYHLKEKISTIISTLEKNGKFTQLLEKAIKTTKSHEELDIIYAPYKPEGKRTLAERAKAVGLEQPATELLLNNSIVNINKYVDISKEELSDVTNVEKGIVHIIAQKIATDSEILSFLRDLRKQTHFTVETKKSKFRKTSNSKPKKKKIICEKSVDESKFENYFDFRTSVRHIKPHQVLAINRGEHHKILSVKILIPDFVFNKFRQFCFEKWIKHGSYNENRKKILEEAIQDSYNRLVQPFISREIRSELKTLAEKASYEVFSKNLKHLLLAAPIKGQTILGIDPGYSHGCKIAFISSMGTVLDHNVLHLHLSSDKRNRGSNILKGLLETYDCNLIALGDGTASKETEEWLTELINKNFFHPIKIKYTIVSEDGASIYSCSPEAKKEFGDMDTNIISAVSLSRRIQDPMAELVKVEPKHLGVGMYQHDLKKKTLEEALDEVVSECVSFVGIDLNTASQALLRRVAGLTEKRASEIVKFRETNGPFTYRKQLIEVSGIGPTVFQQCAGFLRVGPTNAVSTEDFYNNPKTTKLDQTYIHPESYDVAQKLLRLLKLNVKDVGDNNFINKIKSSKSSLIQFQEKLETTTETLELIFDALSKPLNYDLRTEISQTAFFSSGLKSINDLNVGSKVMGRVKNVTHFGCFVDIGVGKDALIHSSKLRKFDLQVGDRIEGIVCSLDKQKQRINVEPTVKL